MAELVFDCVGARAERYAVTPSLTLQLRITDTDGDKVEAIKAMLPYNPDFAWVPSSIKTGPRQPGDTGGKTAFRSATTSATRTAPQKPSISAPGTIHAATISESAETSHAAIRRAGRIVGNSGSQASRSP